MITVPRRKIHAELEALPTRRLRDLLHDVSLAAAPRTASHRMVRGLGRPEAKAIVMFARENHSRQTAGLRRVDDGGCVERGRVEEVRVFVAVPPFPVGEGIDGEVKKSVSLQFVPVDLPFGRQRAIWGGRLARGNRRSR